MGQRTDDLTHANNVTHADAEAPAALEHEVEEIRENMTEIVGELDRRRHEVFDLGSQLRKNAAPLAAAGLGVVFIAAGATTLSVRRRRRRNRPFAKARRFGEALSRMIEHPELVARPRPSIGRKALEAVVSVVAGSLAKTLTERLSSRIGAR
jgi:hypothetical protein